MPDDLYEIIDRKRLTREAELLLAVLDPRKRNLVGKDINTDGVDWELFCKIAYCQSVVEYTYLNLPEHCAVRMPANILEYMRDTYYLSIAQNERLWRELVLVNGRLRENGIAFVLFKGIVFNNFVYRDAYTRQVQDIDIMIKKDDREKLKDVLNGCGYSPVRDMDDLDANDHFMEFIKPDGERESNSVLDIQWGEEASFIDANKNGLSDIWDRARIVRKDGQEILILAAEDMLFNLFFHQRRFGMPFSLKSILDMACIVREYGAVINWDFIVERARKERIKALAFFCLSLAGGIFSCGCPADTMKNLRPGLVRRRIFARLCAKNLCYTGASAGGEMKAPCFVMMAAILYDKVFDIFIYANSISRRQFSRFTGIRRGFFMFRLLYGLKIVCLPVVLLFKSIFKKPQGIVNTN